MPLGAGEQLAVGGGTEQPLPQRAARPADQHARDVALARVVGELLADRRAAERHRLGAERLRELQQRDAAVALGLGQPQQAGGLDVDHDPFGVQRARHALAGAHQPLGLLVRADAHQQALAGGPDRADRRALAVRAHRRVDPVRRGAQRQLAQRDQVALAEEVLDRAPRLLRHVDLALAQALQQLVGRGVDQLDLVGALEHAVRHGLLHADAGDPGHHVVQAFDVLDVHRGVDVDARGEQLLDVLPALGVARARLALHRVAVGELVHQQHPRLARKRGVEVELAQRRAAVAHFEVGQPLQPLQQRLGVGAPVRLDVADHHVDALRLQRVRLLQHRVGLADAGGGAEEDLQPAAPGLRLLALHPREQRVRIGRASVLPFMRLL